ncbi:alpha/beta fold hydrolase [Bacillus sp. SB49]|uniref:alpha/beta fold hydrolase n=1 Tax=Bacillaceae TaxID=186817 RepID=UPI0002A4EB62|nr:MULTISPECIES: alpha/beta fold hydrolase [Bacillaceae]ELK46610.1 AB hydrolase superfamily protein [Halobacillus sp. BAB-2008]QHT45519.1 alpha/beta fold hydrolase [Bacillus sp. SB49]
MKRLYFLHGFMGTAETHFQSQLIHLKEEFELVPLDLPGHGSCSTDAGDPYFPSALQWVIERIQEEGKGFLWGLSLGASLAVHTAIKLPQYVEGIILTGYTPRVPESLTEVMNKQYDYFLHIEEHERSLADQFKALHGDRWKSTLRNVLHGMTFHYPALDDEAIEQLTAPTLVLNGSTEKHEREAAIHMKARNAAIQIGLLPNAGHTANMDQPEACSKLASSFLQGL